MARRYTRDGRGRFKGGGGGGGGKKRPVQKKSGKKQLSPAEKAKRSRRRKIVAGIAVGTVAAAGAAAGGSVLVARGKNKKRRVELISTRNAVIISKSARTKRGQAKLYTAAKLQQKTLLSKKSHSLIKAEEPKSYLTSNSFNGADAATRKRTSRAAKKSYTASKRAMGASPVRKLKAQRKILAKSSQQLLKAGIR